MQQTAVSTMKAIVVDEYGSPKNARLADVDAPKVKDGFLLVRMHAAAGQPVRRKDRHRRGERLDIRRVPVRSGNGWSR